LGRRSHDAYCTSKCAAAPVAEVTHSYEDDEASSGYAAYAFGGSSYQQEDDDVGSSSLKDALKELAESSSSSSSSVVSRQTLLKRCLRLAYGSAVDDDALVTPLREVASWIAEVARLGAVDSKARLRAERLRADHSGSVTRSQRECARVLCRAVFGLDVALTPEMTLKRWFVGRDTQPEKIKCLATYFATIKKRWTSSSKSWTGRQLVFERKVLADDTLAETKRRIDEGTLGKLVVIEGKEANLVDAKGCLRADFANVQLGGGALGRGLVQEEILFVTHPELLAAIPLCDVLGEREAIELRNAERFVKYRGYGWTNFRCDGAYDDDADASGSRFVAFDALDFADDRDAQYDRASVMRELVKVGAACMPAKKDVKTPPPPPAMKPLATGNWGGGVYEGDPVLKALIQWAMASAWGRECRYYSFGRDVRVIKELAADFEGLPIRTLVTALLDVSRGPVAPQLRAAILEPRTPPRIMVEDDDDPLPRRGGCCGVLASFFASATAAATKPGKRKLGPPQAPRQGPKSLAAALQPSSSSSSSFVTLESSKAYLGRLPVTTGALCRNLESEKDCEKLATRARVIVPEKARALYETFLAVKRRSGSKVERRLYATLDVEGLVTRLVAKRPLSFVGADDRYKLRGGREGAGGWERVGRDDEQKPLVLEEYLSYDEIELGALVGASAYTYFINEGHRDNRGQRDSSDPSSFEKKGVYVGLVGPRFERPGLAEWRQMCVDDASLRRGGPTGDLELRDAWATFYGVPLVATYAVAKRDATRFVPCRSPKVLFDKAVYAARIKVTARLFLAEAEDRASAFRQKAHCRVVGVGLGVWKILDQQEAWYVDAFLDAVRSADLPNVAHLEFQWIAAADTTAAVADKVGRTIPVSSTRDAPATPTATQTNTLVVAMFAWDANAYVGNEYWCHNLHSSGDPAAACCSAIPELLNPDLNARALDGKNAKWFP